MRKDYEKPAYCQVDIDLVGVLLNGSVTNVPVLVQEVSVEDYTNGFESGEFEPISFD